MMRRMVLHFAVACALAGCVADRPLRSVETVLEVSAPADGVVLDTAVLGVSAIVLEGPAAAACRWDLLVPPAYAHPGHGATGSVVGELLGPGRVDLLVPSTLLGFADVYAGAVATGRVQLDADVDVILEGVATHPDTGAAVPFSLHRPLDAEVTGLPLVATVPDEGPVPTLHLRFDLEAALSFVDWASPDLDQDGVLTDADHPVGDSVDFGLTSTRAWAFALETH